jgi:putative transposase
MNQPTQRSAGVPPAYLQNNGQDARSPVDGHPARAPFFNPYAEIRKTEHNLPHWHQNGVYCFVTWRLGDALPEEKLARWRAEREAFFAAHPLPWDDTTEEAHHSLFSERIDQWLDAGYGSCLLRDPASREIVETALGHFDGDRYDLTAYVIMPNHVHVLVQLRAHPPLDRLLHSWKSYTAKAINKQVKRTGPLWQEDYWDRLIRNERHFAKCLRYIQDNPHKAKLAPGTYTLYQRSAGVPPASREKGGQDAHTPLSGQDARAPFSPPASMTSKTIQIREALERINEDLLTLSDDIWLNIDHNDAIALEKGVDFKKAFNARQAAFAEAAQGIIEVLESHTAPEETVEEPTERKRGLQDRKIKELDRHASHALGEDFSYKRPFGMRLEGEAYTHLRTWKAVYRQVFAHLRAKDPKRFARLDQADAALSRRGNPYFSRDKGALRQSMAIGDGLFAEVNLSANHIRDSIRRLLAEFSIPEQAITFYLREDRDAD